MIRSRNTISAVAGAIMLGLTAGCADNGPTAVVPPNVPANALFTSYVALGNSLTAGYQSGGIDDSTQQRSYAALLAQAMKTRYAYASLAGSGCPPPIVNFQTQARLANGTAATCSLRNPNTAVALNNVAVPGATSLDPFSVSTSASNTLTTLFLGGKTQVAKAADANPTFISAWIGNNDVLGAALSGILVPTAGVSAGVTSQSAFTTNYTAMVSGLKAIPTVKGAILIGVLNVAGVPALFPVAALQNPAFKAGFDQFAGGTTTILPNCLSAPGNQALVSISILAQMRSGAHPLVIGCAKNSIPGTLVGDIFILDTSEQASLAATVAGYNATIQAAATANGWAYYDPNPLLVTLKTPGTGCINIVPDLANATAPFGACISLDGIHPTVVANRQITTALVTAINAKYGTAISAAGP
ncbi:MAG TPA: SGNH/GDSL hydrolase family protein [Gemmatimonadaceae bacterium]|nr:SGNH/GDSL hydrolase family protein [Gemmatimonadaceae bacterium]